MRIVQKDYNHNKLHNMGIQTDLFCQKLEVGDYVIVKGYWSVVADHLTQIVKINKKSVVLDLQNWNGESRRMLRPGYDCIKVTKEQAKQFVDSHNNVANKYPELLI